MALLVYVIAVVATPREALWAFGIHAAVVGLVVAAARLPMGFLVRRMVVVVPFLVFAAFVALFGPEPDVRWAGVSWSREGIWAAWSISVRAVLGAAAGITVAATHEPSRLLAGLDRLRVPAPLAAIASLMIRYVDLLAAEWQRMRVAQAARGYRQPVLWRDRTTMAAMGSLFVRTYERGERVHHAMLARGYGGRMPRLREDVTPSSGWWPAWLALAAVSTTVAAWVIS